MIGATLYGQSLPQRLPEPCPPIVPAARASVRVRRAAAARRRSPPRSRQDCRKASAMASRSPSDAARPRRRCTRWPAGSRRRSPRRRTSAATRRKGAPPGRRRPGIAVQGLPHLGVQPEARQHRRHQHPVAAGDRGGQQWSTYDFVTGPSVAHGAGAEPGPVQFRLDLQALLRGTGPEQLLGLGGGDRAGPGQDPGVAVEVDGVLGEVVRELVLRQVPSARPRMKSRP